MKISKIIKNERNEFVKSLLVSVFYDNYFYFWGCKCIVNP